MIQEFIDFLRTKNPGDRLDISYRDTHCLALVVVSCRDCDDQHFVTEVLIPFMIRNKITCPKVNPNPSAGLILMSQDRKYKLVTTRAKVGHRFELSITIT